MRQKSNQIEVKTGYNLITACGDQAGCSFISLSDNCFSIFGYNFNIENNFRTDILSVLKFYI